MGSNVLPYDFYDIGMSIYQILVFAYLFYMMNQYHNYEFQRNKRNILMQIIIMLSYNILSIGAYHFKAHPRFKAKSLIIE